MDLLTIELAWPSAWSFGYLGRKKSRIRCEDLTARVTFGK